MRLKPLLCCFRDAAVPTGVDNGAAVMVLLLLLLLLLLRVEISLKFLKYNVS
jgi:hypothetical protein